MRSFLALALAGLLLSFLPLSNPAPQAPARTVLLVRLRPGMAAARQSALFEALEAEVVGQIPQLDLRALSVPAAQAGAALASLRQDPSVVFAEPDARAQAALLPDDPGWVQQWGPQKIGAPSAWNVTAGDPGTVIAVLDSGVTLDHPDLAGQLWTNAGEVPANGLDDDDNGKVDDVWGWRFYHQWTGETYVPLEDNRVADDYGHGTHVAGIAGAALDNGVGIAGIAAGSRLMTVKVLDQYGLGWYFDIAQGIVYAVDNGAQIVNLSLGGKSSSQALQDAVDYAGAHGVLVVAAAGNDGGSVLYPAACEGALAVAATDPADQRPSFSNYGPEVDVAAPGVDIYSTWPWLNGYFGKSGTSMAAPHVSGLAALVYALQPTLSPAQVTGVLTGTAHDVHAAGWDPYTGWGRIDAWAAVLSLPQFSLALTQQVTPTRPLPGAPLTYTITFGKEGDSLDGVVVSDRLPPAAQFASADPPAAYQAATHELVWGPLTLTPGVPLTATVVVTLSAEVAACSRIENTVHLLQGSIGPLLEARLAQHVLPCTLYLPLVSNDPQDPVIAAETGP